MRIADKWTSLEDGGSTKQIRSPIAREAAEILSNLSKVDFITLLLNDRCLNCQKKITTIHYDCEIA